MRRKKKENLMINEGKYKSLVTLKISRLKEVKEWELMEKWKRWNKKGNGG